jgi:hypothetical protein
VTHCKAQRANLRKVAETGGGLTDTFQQQVRPKAVEVIRVWSTVHRELSKLTSYSSFQDNPLLRRKCWKSHPSEAALQEKVRTNSTHLGERATTLKKKLTQKQQKRELEAMKIESSEYSLLKYFKKLDMVIHAYNPSTGEAEEGRLCV